MKEQKVTSVISIFAAGITATFAILKEFSKSVEATIAFYIAIGIFLALFVANIVIFIVVKVKQNRNKDLQDTSSILARSRKVAKDLKKVIKAVEKTIKKFVNKNRSLNNERKNELENVYKNIQLISEASKKLQQKKTNSNLSFFAKTEANVVKSKLKEDIDEQQRILDLNNVVLSSIKEMERALLVLEQYETRIYLGDYVLSHSTNVFDCADALIDYKGWTSSLLGKTKEFKEEVLKGVALLEKFEKENKLTKEEKDKVTLKLARAHRHLGSDVIIARDSPEEAIQENEIAKKILLNHFVESPEQYKGKVLEMYVGIEYGLLNARFFKCKGEIDKGFSDDKCQEIVGIIKELRKITKQAETFVNPHRYIKCVLLENELLKLLEKCLKNSSKTIENNQQILVEMFGERENYAKAAFEKFVDNTAVVENKFKQAIYADEMMEIYINQEVNQLFKRIEEIVE